MFEPVPFSLPYQLLFKITIIIIIKDGSPYQAFRFAFKAVLNPRYFNRQCLQMLIVGKQSWLVD